MKPKKYKRNKGDGGTILYPLAPSHHIWKLNGGGGHRISMYGYEHYEAGGVKTVRREVEPTLSAAYAGCGFNNCVFYAQRVSE